MSGKCEMRSRTCSWCCLSSVALACDWGQTTSGKCFKMCPECRSKARAQYAKTSPAAEEDKLQMRFNRYWNDVVCRNSINEQNKARSNTTVVCNDCKRMMVCGSMYEHKKRCRGHRELTPLEEPW